MSHPLVRSIIRGAHMHSEQPLQLKETFVHNLSDSSNLSKCHCFLLKFGSILTVEQTRKVAAQQSITHQKKLT